MVDEGPLVVRDPAVSPVEAATVLGTGSVFRELISFIFFANRLFYSVCCSFLAFCSPFVGVSRVL